MLVNNNFPNELIDKTVSEFLQKKFPSNIAETSSRASQSSSIPGSNSDPDQIHDSEAHTDSQKGTIALYYRSQMSDDYKKFEKG